MSDPTVHARSAVSTPIGTLAAPDEPWQAPIHEVEVDWYDMEGFARAEPGMRSGRDVPAGARCVRPRDVLLSLRGRGPRRSWVVGESRGRPQVASNDWLVVRAEGIEPAYARHVLVSNAFELAFRGGRGAALDVSLQLPSKSDQARAARVMDLADDLRAKRAKVETRLREFARASYVEQFGPAPESAWPGASLVSLLSEPPSRGIDVDLDARGRFPVIRPGDMHEGEITLSEARWVSNSDAALARTALADGDLLLARDPGGRRVRVAIALPGEAVWFTHARLWRLRLDQERVAPEFLREWLDSRAGGEAISRAWLKGGPRMPVEARLAGLAVPVPPIGLQRRFAERLNAAQRLAGSMHVSALRLDGLLGTLRDLAFRGEMKLA